MNTPLAPTREASLNRATPPSKRRYDEYEVRAVTASTTLPAHGSDSPTSSPFMQAVDDATVTEHQPPSPSKSRHSRVISGAELSPLKILAEQRNSPGTGPSVPVMGPPPQKSPRRFSPVSRFPVKISPHGDDETVRASSEQRNIDLGDMVRDNAGLKQAIDIFEDEKGVFKEVGGSSANSPLDEAVQMEESEELAGPDDTMTSTFSTFSVVPNLTVYSTLGQSPLKNATFGSTSPRTKLQHGALGGPRSSSNDGAGAGSNASNLLMDFTDQMRFPQPNTSGRRTTLSPSRTMPTVAATPDRQVTNLIDFDIPPAPTPRSVPTITPRELESLKSKFMSEISSLKASLSGKEAEVQSLKTAVGDAEKRVGESLEQMREERALKEQLNAEKEGWEKRGLEVQKVLGKMKSEMLSNQREKEELEQKLEESEKRREAAEILHQEAESKMAGMRAGKDCEKASAAEGSASPDKAKASSTREVEMAVERVARELHALYKGKHETKVAALKKSYESRWEKRVKCLEGRISELSDENERIRDREMNATRFDPDATIAEERKVQAVKDGAAIKELEAEIQRLEAMASTVKRDNKELRTMLEKERVEKGELVQLAEEMMSMQSMAASSQQRRQQQQQQESQERAAAELTKTPRASGEVPARSNSGIGRGGATGLRAPGSAIRAPGHIRKGSAGLPRPGARSGIMSSIERMGNYRGRAQE